MAYIGTSPSNGVRRRFVYEATASQTSFSGSDENGVTLTYVDSLYLDVFQNGIKLKAGDDYTATTGTTVVLVQGASANDVVEMVAFDVFSVGDTVSASDGGSFAGTVGFGAGIAGGVVFNEAGADVDFRVESDTITHALFVQGSDGAVGIGTDSPHTTSKLHIAGTMPNIAGGFGQLQVFSTNALGANVGGKISLGGISGQAGIYDPYGFSYVAGLKENATSSNYAGYLAFGTSNAGGSVAEQVRIHSNGVLSASDGIALGVGTANTASNVLDDYEEGTWTPTSSCTGGNGSLGHASQVGHYTKVGNMVNITCYMALSSLSGASGTFRIAGVPFTSKNVANAYITGGLWMNSTANGQIFDGDYNETLYLAPNDTTIRFFAKNGAGANAQLNVSHLGAGSDFMVNITYRV